MFNIATCRIYVNPGGYLGFRDWGGI